MWPDLDQTSVFDESQALGRLDGDRELLIDVLELFRGTSRDLLVSFESAVSASRLDEASSVAHSLKGAASNVSAERVRILAECAEKEIHSRGAEWGGRLLESLRVELEQFIHATASLAQE